MCGCDLVSSYAVNAPQRDLVPALPCCQLTPSDPNGDLVATPTRVLLATTRGHQVASKEQQL